MIISTCVCMRIVNFRDGHVTTFRHVYFLHPLQPWSWISALRGQKHYDGDTRLNKKFDDIFSRADIQCTNVTVRQTTGDSKDRA